MVVDINHDKTLRHKEHEVLVVNQVNFSVHGNVVTGLKPVTTIENQ